MDAEPSAPGDAGASAPEDAAPPVDAAPPPVDAAPAPAWPIDPARAAAAVALPGGPARGAFPLARGGALLVGADDALREAQGFATTALPAAPGTPTGAATLDGALVALVDGALHYLDAGEDAWRLAALTLDGLRTLVDDHDAAWLWSAGGLGRWGADAMRPLALPAAPEAPALLAAGDGACWVVDGATVWQVRLVDASADAWRVTLAAAPDAVAATAAGLWLAHHDLLTRIDAQGAATTRRAPGAVTALAGHPGAADLWLAVDGALWQLRDARLRPIEDAAAPPAMVAEASGALLRLDDDALRRLTPGAAVRVEGLADGAAVEAPRTVAVQVAPLEGLEVVRARVGEAAALDLEGPPFALALDPAAVGRGAHRVEIEARYVDGEVARAAFTFAVRGPATWRHDVQPLFAQACAACHDARGAAHQMDDAAAWRAEFDDILAAVRAGRMPLAPRPRLTDAAIERLIDWRDRGFLERWP